MELSQEIQDILQKYRPQRLARNVKDDELIDVAQIDLSNDQTWLVQSESVDDLSNFLKSDFDLVISSDSDTPTLSELTRKSFDSRTFTRPKKKLNCPSIEKYNDEYFADETKTTDEKWRSSLCEEIDKYISISSTTLEDGMAEKPLHFDLSQPITTSIFDKILANTSELDSFQNMSPPSLVNSMCSSTFTNLMENSYIKNDPILREIRDADYSSVIYQEAEPPLYQSITGSCSSINTEVAETFVRKTLNSLNCTFNKSQMEVSMKANNDEPQVHTENIDPNSTYSPLNGTYKKNKSLNQSLNKTFEYETQLVNISPNTNQQKLNSTFEIDVIPNTQPEFIQVFEKERLEIENLDRNSDDDHNSTFNITKQAHRNNFNTYKQESPRKLNSTFNKTTIEKSNSSITIPTKIDNYMIDSDDKSSFNKSKRLSDEIDEYLTQKLINSYCKEEKSFNQFSAESTDSLDRLSSISNSSRESKLMAEVDAIVERQERSLGLQVMSTPKPAKSLNKLFENSHLSPIPALNMKEHLSDSEVSSDEYNTVRSKFSEQQTARSYRSLNNLKYDASKPRTLHTIQSRNIQRPDTTITRPTTGSSLRQIPKTLTGSYSNLKTFNTNLKGSYTNLRPRSMVLPNIPLKSSDGDLHAKHEEFKVPQVPATYAREPACNPNGTLVKPKVSSLPRPVGTGIPRPTSRIPGPRTSRLPLSKTKATSRTNLNDGYY